jgi:hypothetical protein
LRRVISRRALKPPEVVICESGAIAADSNADHWMSPSRLSFPGLRAQGPPSFTCGRPARRGSLVALLRRLSDLSHGTVGPGAFFICGFRFGDSGPRAYIPFTILIGSPLKKSVMRFLKDSFLSSDFSKSSLSRIHSDRSVSAVLVCSRLAESWQATFRHSSASTSKCFS